LAYGSPEAGLDNHAFNSVWKFDKQKQTICRPDGT